MAKDPIVIIGTGLAGYNLAREFRKLDQDTELVMLTQDDGVFYSKPMLSNALAKQKQPQDLHMADAKKMETDLMANIFTNETVKYINPIDRFVLRENGDAIVYDKLVLAVGARPFIVPMQGNATDDILTINNLVDYRKFREKLNAKKSVAIIGPGLIGCEFANDLAANGYEVSVIGPDQAPISTLLPIEAGQMLQQALSAIGVNWYLQNTVAEVNHSGSAYKLLLNDGQEVQADLVISAIGLRANTELAKQSGLNCQAGIVVDRTLQTSNKNIFALGDCAEVGGQVLPFVMPLMQCARSLAATLCGNRTEVSYPAMPVLIKTPVLATVVSPPARGSAGEWQIEKSENGLKALFKQGNELLGFALLGDATSEKMALTKLLPAVLS